MQQWVAGVVVLISLAACGQGEERSPVRPPADPVPLETLRVKLRALMSDPCYREPSAQRPEGCEKFVTQLDNTASSARQTARAGYPRLAAPVHRMDKSITAYRAGRCGDPEPRSEESCVRALTELAAAMDDFRDAVATG